MRRAGPDLAAPKKTSNGRESAIAEAVFPANGALKPGGRAATRLSFRMWEAYRIGLALGLGISIGSLLAAVLAPRRSFIVIVSAVAAAGGGALGYAIGGWNEAIAGVVGGILGTVVVSFFVAGALARGGTRGGTAALVGLASLVMAALALVPVVGYLEAVALPAAGARARRRRVDRYAGLRSLARD